jgi:hypothetical protein
MPNPDPRRELATLETCDTFLEFGVCTCWPKCTPSAPSAMPDPVSWLELRLHELRSLVAGYDAARLAELPAPERRLIEETQLHLAEYDRAKRGEGGHG